MGTTSSQAASLKEFSGMGDTDLRCGGGIGLTIGGVIAEWWACLLLTISTTTSSAQPSDSPEKSKDLKCSKFVSGLWGNVVCAAFGIIILGEGVQDTVGAAAEGFAGIRGAVIPIMSSNSLPQHLNLSMF